MQVNPECVDRKSRSRIFRGGAWYVLSKTERGSASRISYRNGCLPMSRCVYLGFRIVLGVKNDVF